ncbi:hypothetical protein [Flavilitoribacter nigricans]|uniref:Uncharacterized protein n=1 Tax=Flavilitoribacter nigricans (strain ATCC 23147 / DSM 23189 / NBRC 102662 / NCIMB 1420 / SS-2) TaxID=1122177 RepID=A0A2D0NIG5_FLAN2|nr:hypothetical protein [Flavilitoribacter nigricans]PHN08180.1 hypothetical protein CRP01_02340 [Flavilitoribacter nigricans DSM 23189 = NBRC 102662]
MVGITGTIWQSKSRPRPAEPAFQYLTNDSITLDIYETFDAAGLLNGYRTHVRTPVCEDRLCYDAELDFFWDLLGKFTHFETDPAKPLTKLDHVPFTAADYERLDRILRTESPAFIHLRRSELIVEPEQGDETIDGVTGATVQAVRQDMVAGAIYTCYTLWHIANGGITFRIQEHSRKQLEAPLIRKLLREGNAREHYFLLENMAPEYFAEFLEPVLDLADRYQAFFAARIGEQLPPELFGRPEVQTFFQQHFSRLDLSAQEVWIDRLAAVPRLDASTRLFLIEQLTAGNPPRNQQIIKLLIDRSEPEETEVFAALFTQLLDHGIRPAPGILGSLDAIAAGDRQLKKMLKRLKKL